MRDKASKLVGKAPLRKILFTVLILLLAFVLGLGYWLSGPDYEVTNFEYDYIASENDSHVSFEAELLEEDVVNRFYGGSSAIIELSLENPEGKNFMTSTGVYPPFSVLWAENSSEHAFPLWSDGYEETSGVMTRGFPQEKVTLVKQPLIGKEWQGNVSRTYKVRPDRITFLSTPIPSKTHLNFDRVEPGNYTIEDTIGYSDEPGLRGDEELNYQINFTLE